MVGAVRRPLRLLHTADLHVAGGFTTPKSCGGGHECLCSILSVERMVAEHEVDALLVAGDLFDHGRVPAGLVAEVFDVLARLPVPCVLLAGNHDVHDAAGIYRRHADEVSRAGVHFLADGLGSTLELFDGALTLWGKAMDEHSPAYRPLHGVAPRPDESWYVVLGHGHYVGDVPPEREMRSSPITAPDIAATRADYVALGHWHVTTDVSEDGVAAWYPGSPVQSWADGSALLVELDPGAGVDVTALPIGPVGDGCR
ncbi:MAG: hypothetical protein GEV08_21555 [Acidimicrobiia bacterium]|nr:hypothetical protein [Acidimicrobiia bacterium]